MAKRRLSRKRRAFAHAYVTCFNGAKAARMAGYSHKSAKVTASRLLAIPEVRAEIDRLIEQKSKMTTGEIITRLEAQATSDISMFLKPGTLQIDPKKVHELGYLIKQIMLTRDGSRLTLYDSQKALELLGKSRALFVERTVLEMMTGMDIVDDKDESDGKKAEDSPARTSPKAKDN